MQLSEIADGISAKIYIPNDFNIKLEKHIDIKGIAPLSEAKAEELSFLTNPKFASKLYESKAGAIILSKALDDLPVIQLISNNPYAAMAKASQLFSPLKHAYQGQSELAFVDPSATVSPNATIFPYAYIGKNSVLKDHVVVYPHAFIGENCKIGERTVIYPNAVLMEGSEIGKDVLIQAGAVLGGDGFGFAKTSEKIEKIPQLGRVVIEDEVEVGALVSIDRATFDKTIVRKGTKLDAQVHLAHNVEVGEMSMLCGQVGIAGSTKIGKSCIIAGQGAVADGLTIADGVILGPKSATLQSIDKPGVYHGNPSQPGTSWKRQTFALQHLSELRKTVKLLEKRVSELEK